MNFLVLPIFYHQFDLSKICELKEISSFTLEKSFVVTGTVK